MIIRALGTSASNAFSMGSTAVHMNMSLQGTRDPSKARVVQISSNHGLWVIFDKSPTTLVGWLEFSDFLPPGSHLVYVDGVTGSDHTWGHISRDEVGTYVSMTPLDFLSEEDMRNVRRGHGGG